MLTNLASLRQWQQALQLFQASRGMARELRCYTALLSSLAVESTWPLALELLADMERHEVRPDTVCWGAVLAGIGAEWRWALQLLQQADGVSASGLRSVFL